MYTADIIQLIIILFAGKCWILFLQQTDNIKYITGDDGSASYWYMENGNLIFPGWLFTSAITLIIIWPVSYEICSIPGASYVL
jgi:hypothetical protein